MTVALQSSIKASAGKVAVFMGGTSAEREISLQSGRAVLEALLARGINAVAVDVDENIVETLLKENFDHVFIVLHGRGGEDGTIQGFLEILGLPYTGSGVMASAIAMDKLRTKQIWRASGLPTPVYSVLNSENDCAQALQDVGLPMIVKPVLEGSSIGMSKVEHESELIDAWQKAKQCGGIVIAEEWVTGKEYTAAILGNRVLPMIRLQTTHKFYDFKAKYESNDTQYICPCGLTNEDESLLAELMKKAFDAVGAEGWGRVDFIIDEEGLPWLIEVNTVPGMTSHSLVPMAAQNAGISFEELVVDILDNVVTKANLNEVVV